MAVRNILKIGNPLLRKRSEPVPESELRSQEIKKLIRDMFDTMKEAQGVGLAAPQVGVLKRIIVVGIDRSADNNGGKSSMEYRVLINPEIEIMKAEKRGYWEGCLSIPGMSGLVERSRKIRMKWYDEKEEFHDEVIEGFDAVVYQHEFDHLEGVLYVDRLKDTRQFGYNEELHEKEIDI